MPPTLLLLLLLIACVAPALGGATVTGQWEVGAFTVSCDASMSVSVVHSRDAGRTLWSTVPNTAWLAVGATNFSTSIWGGNFVVTDEPQWQSTQQTLTGATKTATGGVAFSGVVEAPGGAYKYTLSFEAPAANGPNQLSFAVAVAPTATAATATAAAANEVYLTYGSSADEAFFGFGAQYTHLNVKGRVVPVLTREQGVGRGLQPLTKLLNSLYHGAGGAWNTTYSPSPHYITSTNRSLFLTSPEYSVFDLRNPDRVQLKLVGPNLAIQGRILYGNSPLQLVQEFTNYTGRMAPLPDWSSSKGAIVGMEGGTAQVLANVKQLEAHNVPVAGVWLQDWTGERIDSFGKRLWWNWEVDEEHYWDWTGMLQSFMAKGIRVMTYINPFLANTVTAEKKNFKHDYFKEAAAMGYLVKNASGMPYIQNSGSNSFTFGTVDLTNPEAAAWFSTLIECNMLFASGAQCAPFDRPSNATVGALGWMADFGEYLPFDAVLASGQDAASVHNQFPQLWAQANRVAVKGAGFEGNAVFFSRSGWLQSPQYSTLFWMGDQLVTFDGYDGMASAMRAMMSYGFGGVTLGHSDIGGYTMIHKLIFKYLRTKELLLRWMEMSAFSDAIFRTHPGNLPSQSWQYNSDNETLAHFGAFARVHAALHPYRAMLMQEAHISGTPVVRHPWLHYPADAQVLPLVDQFMLGPDLMVAPVVAPNRTWVTAYLPSEPRGWFNLWTNTTYDTSAAGTTVNVTAQGVPGVFVRRDSTWGASITAAVCKATNVCKF